MRSLTAKQKEIRRRTRAAARKITAANAELKELQEACGKAGHVWKRTVRRRVYNFDRCQHVLHWTRSCLCCLTSQTTTEYTLRRRDGSMMEVPDWR